MLELDLDEQVETALVAQARQRGVRPAELATELVRNGLRREDPYPEEKRRLAIAAMKEDREGRYLGLDGRSMSQFIHEEHKY